MDMWNKQLVENVFMLFSDEFEKEKNHLII